MEGSLVRVFKTPASLLFRLRAPEDKAAWDRFVELYSPLLYHWAKLLGCQESDRADLVQDVFVILWRKMPEFEYDAGRSFHAWLKTVFMNRFRTLARQRAPQNMESGEQISGADAEVVFDDSEDMQYVLRKVLSFIEIEFSELHQQVFREYVLQERDPDAIASALGISVGTVYGIKSKVLSRLKQEVRQIFDGWSAD